jgi:tetratricopeptide (TPR) repeat protein
MTDTISAQRAMKIAKSYIDETANIDTTDRRVVKNARSTLSLAAKQLAQAYKADPNATIDLNEAQLGIPYLRSSVLTQEGITWEHFNPKKAVDCVRQATYADPSNPFAFHLLGVYLMALHKTAQAKKALTRAAELDPENPEILKDLDRAKNTSMFSLAGFHAAGAGIGAANILIFFWNIIIYFLYVCFLPFRIVGWFMGYRG